MITLVNNNTIYARLISNKNTPNTYNLKITIRFTGQPFEYNHRKPIIADDEDTATKIGNFLTKAIVHEIQSNLDDLCETMGWNDYDEDGN